MGIMRKLKYSISRYALNQMYISYMLPVIEYASIVWDGYSEQDSQTLPKIHNEAARLVTGLTRYVSLENLYIECEWCLSTYKTLYHNPSGYGILLKITLNIYIYQYCQT